MPIHEAALWSAYQQTRYVAWRLGAGVGSAGTAPAGPAPAGEAELEIQVGASTPALDVLLAAHGAVSWCFITAANPRSERLDEAENLERNRVLRTELEAAGFVVLRGEGRGADDTWPPEPSFLVLGPNRTRATCLGRRHGQNAIVFGEAGRPAELIDCRPFDPSHGAANV